METAAHGIDRANVFSGMTKRQEYNPAYPTQSSRKKSTASTDNEEDDISNIPSLQMRIQIIQQRVSKNRKLDVT